MAENFDLDGEFKANGQIPVMKFKSKLTGMTVYFADIDSPVISGYFAFGTDRSDVTSIESLLWHLDSSGGLLPRPMRGDMLRPVWQFHGAENPLADRDQSCFICCAFGENAFLGTFACCVYLIQNIEAIFEIHGVQSSAFNKHLRKLNITEDQKEKVVNPDAEPEILSSSDELDDLDEEGNVITEPKINEKEHYILSEGGEGAMAWETTIQAMYPGVKAFWNRLISQSKHKINLKMRETYEKIYRPENMSVIITGTIEDKAHILECLFDHEKEYFEQHQFRYQFKKPWSEPIPPCPTPFTSEVRFVPRYSIREPTASICFGWRGCQSYDLETTFALKVITAHLSVSPFWDSFVTEGLAHRISWCQLDYLEVASLVTLHGVKGEEAVSKVTSGITQIIKNQFIGGEKEERDYEALKAMADRMGWHYVRELETDPNLIIAAVISKAERYGRGEKEQLNKRLNCKDILFGLAKKPLDFWKAIYKTYFLERQPFITKVLPKIDGGKSEGGTVHEVSGEKNFAESAKRASSRPRRKGKESTGEEAGVAIDEDVKNQFDSEDLKEIAAKEGHIEAALRSEPFPFGEQNEEVKEFEERLEMTVKFLENVKSTEPTVVDLKTYRSDSAEQHPNFPLTSMPFFTIVEDVKSEFAYITVVIDTSHLNAEERKFLAPITAAIGALLCPRPPGLDTDAEIIEPNQFNPPFNVADSQASIGLNGEMMQHIFTSLIVRKEHYKWAVGMLHFLLYGNKFTPNFLKFVCTESATGLASTYRMQTATSPNYNAFDASEINLHSLIKMIYKEESNARLFVGRRRLDLVMEFLGKLEKDEAGTFRAVNETWRKMVDCGNVIVQIAGNISELAAVEPDLVKPWKDRFVGVQKPLVFQKTRPTMEKDMMLVPGKKGVIAEVNHYRPSCLSLAIQINPNHEDFAKVCVASQLYSMAQKWVWGCMDEDDSAVPCLRMPCSFANVLTLNLETQDVIGAYEAMKKIVDPDWPWLKSLLIATKLMVVNDPASMELGVQGTITSSLLSQLNGQEKNSRTSLLHDCMKVEVDDIKYATKEYLMKLFDPEHAWCAVMATGEEKTKIVNRLESQGFSFSHETVEQLCSTL